MAPSWSERVVAGVVVVVGARVVATTQVGGVHESMLGSPSFLPNTLAIELNLGNQSFRNLNFICFR